MSPEPPLEALSPYIQIIALVFENTTLYIFSLGLKQIAAPNIQIIHRIVYCNCSVNCDTISTNHISGLCSALGAILGSVIVTLVLVDYYNLPITVAV